MTDHNDTGATARPWRFVPSHVAEGPSEVRSPEGWLICTTSSDADAALIERAVNAYEPLKARLAEVEREAVARALCESGKFETGEGTCSLLCMDQLGSVRKKGCNHLTRVHGKLVDSILSLLRPAEPAEAALGGWTYEIQHGLDGEAAYAWVYDKEHFLVCTAKIHHAKSIVNRMNAAVSKSPDIIELLKLAYDNMFDGEAREQIRRKLFE